MLNCSKCGQLGCRSHELDRTLPDCPMHDPENEEIYEFALNEIKKEENNKFYITCSQVEKEGYNNWSRLKETVTLCEHMNYKKIGLAFCVGLAREAAIVTKVFEAHGIKVISAACKTGSIPKENAGIPQEYKMKEQSFEAMCNPIAQAKFFERENTDFNVMLGLCVGHDSMFYKYSHTFVTTLVVKDRVLAHNPVGAIYQAHSYYKNKL